MQLEVMENDSVNGLPILIQVVGALFLLYGISKIVIFLTILAIPPKVQDKLADVPLINSIITGDRSDAGHGIEYVLLVFGIFSVFHGLAMLNGLPVSMSDFVLSRSFQFTFYILCGTFMIIFYSLVLYTNVQISKKPENYDVYWIYAFLVGPSFLAVPVIWQLSLFLIPIVSNMFPITQLFLMIVLFFVVLFIALYILWIYNIRMDRYQAARASKAIAN